MGKKKEKCFYGGATYAEVGNSSLEAKTLGQRFTVAHAIMLRDALTRTIARCEIAEAEKLEPFNVITVTTHKENGQVTVLARYRKKPLKKGLGTTRKLVRRTINPPEISARFLSNDARTNF